MSYIDRCYYRTSTVDPETSLPLYVLDSTFIPSSIFNGSTSTSDIDSQPKLRNFVNRILEKLPQEDHALVFFTNGFYQSSLVQHQQRDTSPDNTHSSASVPTSSITNSSEQSSFKLPLNIIKILKLIPPESKKHLSKIYIVHSTWLLKSIVDLFTKFYSFNSTNHPVIINCNNLTTLSHYVDITKLLISLHTYMIDKIQYKNNKIVMTRHFTAIYGRPLTLYSLHNLASSSSSIFPLNQFARIFNNLIAYLSNKDLDTQLSVTDWTTIIRCSALSNETKISIDILSDCLKRDQLIVLADFSFLEHYMIIVKFILKLSNSKSPLIPLEVLISHRAGPSQIDFKDVEQVNYFMNEVLTFRHPLIDLSNHSNASSSGLQTPPTSAGTAEPSSLEENYGKSEIDSYDNSYILIKLFKLFRYLLNKLEREACILEPHAKNKTKSVERQTLRLILAFTKILYADNQENSSPLSSSQEDLDYDDIGFDNLFKLLRSIMQYFDKLTILGTSYTLDDFNNHISFDDFLAFEAFKNKQLGIQDVLESKLISHKKQPEQQCEPTKTSPLKPKRQLDIVPPLPPMPRKNHLLYIESKTNGSTGSISSRSTSASSHKSDISSTSSSSYMQTSAESTIPVTRSEVDILAKSVESLGLEEEKSTTIDYDVDNVYKTPQRTTRNDQFDDISDTETLRDMVGDLLTPTKPLNYKTSTSSIADTLLTPSPRKQARPVPAKPAFLESMIPAKNSKLRKYTEKDLEVQQQAEKIKKAAILKEQHAKEVEKGVRRGERKVSRLARLYEEKYMPTE